jgi:Site-specific recombinase XerD
VQRGKAPYSLQKRPANKKEAEKRRQGKPHRHVNYVQFRDADGNYTSAISSSETSEGAAREWAHKYMKKGNIPTHQGYTFGLYAADWWIPGKCRYLKEKEQSGRLLSPRYILESRRNLEKRLIPHFGSMKMTNVRYKDIWDWKNGLYEEGLLNPATINRSLATLKIMFKQAMREEYIQSNPCADIGILHETPKPKTILSPVEAKKLFTKAALSQVWNDDLRMFTINLLAATTGMRLGEIKALQYGCIHDGLLEIRYSWSDRTGLKDTKNHMSRIVPMMEKVKPFLLKVIELSSPKEPDEFVFHQPKSDRPYSTKAVDDALYAALKQIGISEEERRQRNVVFHSWRYFFNTLCRSRGIPDSLTHIVMGHKTSSMTDLYTSPPVSELKAILVLEDSVFAKKTTK